MNPTDGLTIEGEKRLAGVGIEYIRFGAGLDMVNMAALVKGFMLLASGESSNVEDGLGC